MKHIKTFENNIVDNILDKISKYGIKSISSIEQEYLDKYQKGDISDIEKDMINRQNRVDSLFKYDPRNDQEYYKEFGDNIGVELDFSKYDDDMIDDGRYSILWDELEDIDIDHFIQIFDIKDIKDNDDNYKSWSKLSNKEKDNFKNYIDNIY